MANGKKSFILYCDIIHIVNHLDNEKAGVLFKHILEYVNDKKPVCDDPFVNLAFEPIKQQLKRDLQKWDEYIDKQKINGAKGGRPKKTQKTQAFLEKPKKADNVNVNVNDNVNVINNIEDRKHDFKKSLFPFLDIYGKDMLKDFFEYWTEHGEKDKKFRKEKEKSFNTELRLKTWYKRQEDWKKEKSSAKKEKVDAADIILKEYGIK